MKKIESRILYSKYLILIDFNENILIPQVEYDYRENLEQSHKNLENVAVYCEEKYLKADVRLFFLERKL